MKKNILIVNENLQYAEKLREMVLGMNRYLEITLIDNVKNAYEYIMNITVDMFILDTVMDAEKPGDISGIRLAEQIREIKKYVLTPIIFVTTAKDPELYAYEELNCLGYFVKPFPIERFLAKVRRGLYYRTVRNEDRTLFFRKGGIIYPIRIKEIAYIESIAHSMYIHMVDGNVVEVLYKTYSSILREADSECLLQCSRSVVLNKKYIMSLDFPNRSIVMKYDLGKIDIGSTYKKRVKEEFDDIIF